jgi:hypothetical protein
MNQQSKPCARTVPQDKRLRLQRWMTPPAVWRPFKKEATE